MWDCLHQDILEGILKEVVLLSDFIRFGAVCKTWYYVFLMNMMPRLTRCEDQVPLLFVTAKIMETKPPAHNSSTMKTDNLVQSETHQFDIFLRKCYSFSMSPYSCDRKCYRDLGSCYGWVTTAFPEKLGTKIILHNPITKSSIPLPDVPGTKAIYRVALSCNPSIDIEEECVVAYIGKNNIALIRWGEKTWTELTTITPDNVSQILFHKGKLYALYNDAQLFVFDCHRGLNTDDKCDFQTCHTVKTSKVRAGATDCMQQYLVESANGDLVMIERCWDADSSAICMYKLVITYEDGNEKGHWVGIHKLGNGDEVLFMSCYNSLCVLASKSLNLRPNSVYLVQDKIDAMDECYEIRMFSLDTSKMQRGELTEFGVTLKERVGTRDPAPFWINPTFNCPPGEFLFTK